MAIWNGMRFVFCRLEISEYDPKFDQLNLFQGFSVHFSKKYGDEIHITPSHIYKNGSPLFIIQKTNILFQSIYSNSKAVKNQSIYIIDAKKKIKQEYIRESITKGAVALITTKYYKNFLIPQYIVKNINKNKKHLLCKLFPKHPLNSVAVTGTNGKTSVVWFISQICELNNEFIKTYGTLGYYKNGKKILNSSLTTPELEILYQSAFLKKKKNLYNFAFEVSSHSLAQNRIKNFPIDIAAITNISHDHLDYHKTFENYKKSKLRLFTHELKKNGIAIISPAKKN